MTSPKKIEINQSSLLGLKAELERKRKEIASGKCGISATAFHIRPKRKEKKKSEEPDKNAEKIEEVETDLLIKSRTALETKAKTYASLSGDGIVGEIDATEFLVDFKRKRQEEDVEKSTEDDSDPDGSDEEWVDYVDCLGRTRRCHRDDYETIKDQDQILETKLFGESEVGVFKEDVSLDSFKPSAEEEKKEAVRQKWEDQERILLGKKDVHYQDVLFNEARSHGVGYYEFSTDEGDRCRQQEELKRTREETLKRQDAARDASEKKKKQLEERLKAARKRKRERLGLPLEEERIENEIEKETETETERKNLKDSENRGKVESLHREKRGPSKRTPIRPWDLGKEGTPSVLSQEEWVEKKRTERIDEFAPPSDSRFFRKRKGRKPDVAETDCAYIAPKRGAQIPPPQSYDSAPAHNVSPNLEKSIEEGLKFLREQTERNLGKRGGCHLIS